jgi:hypothetical protein
MTTLTLPLATLAIHVFVEGGRRFKKAERVYSAPKYT